MPNRQYPKPLSERSLQKKYAELNLSREKTDFMKEFILACTNLYGRISIRDIWRVYKKLAENKAVPQIKRTDIVQISEILRREDLPYYVYEVDELYSDEVRRDSGREFVSKYLVGRGQGKFTCYYYVARFQASYDYYVPNDLLSYAQPQKTEQEKRLLELIGRLKVTAGEYKNPFGIIFKCPDHRGETLNSFSFMNHIEAYDYRYANGEIRGRKGNPKEAQRLLDICNSITEAEKIVDQIKWYGNIGHVSPTEIIQYTLDELGEAGVELTEHQLKKLIKGIADFHNYSHLMCMGGWSPEDFEKQTERMPTISFGPGIKKAIAEGNMNREELIQAIKSMGFEYSAD